jgi:cell division protein FtsL
VTFTILTLLFFIIFLIYKTIQLREETEKVKKVKNHKEYNINLARRIIQNIHGKQIQEVKEVDRQKIDPKETLGKGQ